MEPSHAEENPTVSGWVRLGWVAVEVLCSVLILAAVCCVLSRLSNISYPVLRVAVIPLLLLLLLLFIFLISVCSSFPIRLCMSSPLPFRFSFLNFPFSLCSRVVSWAMHARDTVNRMGRGV
jgi:hypothetical protein